MPITPLSGVRSSWLMWWTKPVSLRCAFSAASRARSACRNRSSARVLAASSASLAAVKRSIVVLTALCAGQKITNASSARTRRAKRKVAWEIRSIRRVCARASASNARTAPLSRSSSSPGPTSCIRCQAAAAPAPPAATTRESAT